MKQLGVHGMVCHDFESLIPLLMTWRNWKLGKVSTTQGKNIFVLINHLNECYFYEHYQEWDK
jgi:hypothetical protein